jgi:UDPglucose 6-dehydrogenase
MNLAVIGLGKLGLPLAALLANSGNKVLGFDSSMPLRDSIASGNFRSNEPNLEEVLKNSRNNLQIVNSIEEAVRECSAVFIIVPTPSLDSGHFSNRFVVQVLNTIGNAIKSKETPTVVDIVSTVMPGSCDGELKSTLENSSGKKLGKDLGLCYNPEFIALGSVLKDMSEPDMHLVGASHDWAADVVEKALNSMVKKPVPCRRMSLVEAELVKISVNNFVTMKISFANSLMQVASKLGDLNIDVVTEAIGLDSRVGNKYLKAAVPYGGPCFPRDTRALSALYRDFNVGDSLPLATEALNSSHLEYLTDFVIAGREATTVIGIVGLSYKTGTPVIDESPGVNLAKKLVDRGFTVFSWDDEGADSGPESKIIKVESLGDLISAVDLLVISRPHFNWHKIKQELDASGKIYFDFWRQK